MSEAAMEEALTGAVNAGSYNNQPTWEIVASVIKGPLATALAEAKAEGRRQGLEEAAKVVQAQKDYDLTVWGTQSMRADECTRILTALSLTALATAPAETQKPEETA